jgi:hypothetical protein
MNAERDRLQQLLSELEEAVAKAERVCKLQMGRPVKTITAVVTRYAAARRQLGFHLIAAADRALRDLDPVKSAA